MRAPLTLLLHGIVPWHDAWTQWTFAPEIVMPLVVLGGMYIVGARRFARSAGWRTTCFVAGWITLMVALVSPVHAISEQVFTAHMIQHELLMAVATPLLVLGEPVVPVLLALPRRAQRVIGRVLRQHTIRAVWRFVSQPSVAWSLHAVAIWVWHLPGLFQQTLTSDAVHAAQHLSFLGTAAIFWWSLLDKRRVATRGAAVVYLFTTALHAGALGALLALSRGVWYPAYAGGAALWGLTPLEDQQLGGLIMWIPGTVPYLIAALLLFPSWLSRHPEPFVADAPFVASVPRGKPQGRLREGSARTAFTGVRP
jgi:cytochrome c oxidase assembly factor CtaG